MIGVDAVGSHPGNVRQSAVADVGEDLLIARRHLRSPLFAIAHGLDCVEGTPDPRTAVLGTLPRIDFVGVEFPRDLLCIEQVTYRAFRISEARERALLPEILTVDRQERSVLAGGISVATPREITGIVDDALRRGASATS